MQQLRALVGQDVTSVTLGVSCVACRAGGRAGANMAVPHARQRLSLPVGRYQRPANQPLDLLIMVNDRRRLCQLFNFNFNREYNVTFSLLGAVHI